MTQELIEIGGTIIAGRLTLEGRTVVEQQLRNFPDGPVTVRISSGKRQRTHAQNRYWHGVVIPLFAEHCGYGLAEMKDALALHLIPREVVDIKTGEIHLVPGQTHKLTVSEFNDLILRAQVLGAEMPSPLYIPDPGELPVELAS